MSQYICCLSKCGGILLLVIDNYDSFTWNLIQYLKILNIPFCIRANDEIDANFVISLNPSGVLLSPGPGEPKDAGNCIDIVKKISKNKFESIPVLGVCLGHQIIAEAFGGSIRKAKSPMHGKISSITNIQTDIFSTTPKTFDVVRYHSLVVDKLPPDFKISAVSNDDHEVKAISSQKYHCYGIQFHPEALLTEFGLSLLDNFYKICKKDHCQI